MAEESGSEGETLKFQLKSYQERKNEEFRRMRRAEANQAQRERDGGSTEDGSCNLIGIGPARGSIKLCVLPVLGGIPLHIHYLWPVFILLSTLASTGISWVYALFTCIVSGPILFVSVLIHEIGHCAMARYFNGNVDMILLWPLGGLAYVSYFGEDGPKADALVAIAGPLTHLPQAIFWAVIMATVSGGYVRLAWPVRLTGNDFFVALCASGLAIQLALFLFNLIPAFPLDGGRLLGAFLAWRKFDVQFSLRVTAIMGWASGSLLMYYSVRTLSGDSAHGDPSSYGFFAGWNTLMLAVFILANCYSLWRQAEALGTTQPAAMTLPTTRGAAAGAPAWERGQRESGGSGASGGGNTRGAGAVYYTLEPAAHQAQTSALGRVFSRAQYDSIPG